MSAAQRSVTFIYVGLMAAIPFITVILAVFVWPSALRANGEVVVAPWLLAAAALALQATVVWAAIPAWGRRRPMPSTNAGLTVMFMEVAMAEAVPFLVMVLGWFRLGEPGSDLAAIVGAVWVLEVLGTMPTLRRVLAIPSLARSETARPS